jgi:hypothetical protein
MVFSSLLRGKILHSAAFGCLVIAGSVAEVTAPIAMSAKCHNRTCGELAQKAILNNSRRHPWPHGDASIPFPREILQFVAKATAFVEDVSDNLPQLKMILGRSR